VLEPLVERSASGARRPAASGRGVMTAVWSRVPASNAGLILLYLSSRVLGHNELFLLPP